MKRLFVCIVLLMQTRDDKFSVLGTHASGKDKVRAV
jgi:hypothetical protein